MRAGREETSALFGFLAGLHPVVTELVLLCNGVFPGRGFPPLLLLGRNFFSYPPTPYTYMHPPKVIIHLAF